MLRQLAPQSSIDLFSDAVLRDPYPAYRELRDTGAAVWLPQYEMFAITRYKDVRDALRDWETFSSARGVGYNDIVNSGKRGSTLASDNPEHELQRSIIGRPLGPPAVRDLVERIGTEAETLVARLVAAGGFDAVEDLAWHLPLTIVSRLVGLPEEGRERMTVWSGATTDAVGPLNERGKRALAVVKEQLDYIADPTLRDRIVPGSWAAKIFEAGDNGEIAPERCPALLNDYLAPSLDTTVSAIGSAIWFFATHPDQWNLVRAEPALIPGAVNEVIRLESPIQGFSRYLARDADIDGIRLPQGSRAALIYASANRDERKWDDPERFDIRRRSADQLGFGHGVHVCVGMHLAQLEIASLLSALAKRVERFEFAGKPERLLTNGLRGFKRLPVTVVTDKGNL
jgi:cytochrome P450